VKISLRYQLLMSIGLGGCTWCFTVLRILHKPLRNMLKVNRMVTYGIRLSICIAIGVVPLFVHYIYWAMFIMLLLCDVQVVQGMYARRNLLERHKKRSPDVVKRFHDLVEQDAYHPSNLYPLHAPCHKCSPHFVNHDDDLYHEYSGGDGHKTEGGKGSSHNKGRKKNTKHSSAHGGGGKKRHVRHASSLRLAETEDGDEYGNDNDNDNENDYDNNVIDIPEEQEQVQQRSQSESERDSVHQGSGSSNSGSSNSGSGSGSGSGSFEDEEEDEEEEEEDIENQQQSRNDNDDDDDDGGYRPPTQIARPQTPTSTTTSSSTATAVGGVVDSSKKQ
jgi:hypothetical protein